MTLSDLLDDVATAEPVTVRGDRAWRRGRRDLLRDRAGAVLGVAAVLGALVLVAPSAGVPAVGPASAASGTGYPQELDRQWWVRELPDRPGPVAALLERVDEREGYDEADGWYAVAADGHRWRLPGDASTGQVPAVSPDGRRVGYLLDDGGPFVVHDLVSGERTTFAEISGNGRADRARRYQQQMQSPARFSPDGTRVLLNGITDERGAGLLLDVADGTVTVLESQDLGSPTGWLDDDRIAWLGGSRGTLPGPTARITDLTGRVLYAVQLRGRVETDQWAGVASPDGRSLAVYSDGAFDSDAALRVFDLATGEQVSQTGARPQSCGRAWPAGYAAPLVPTLSDGVLRLGVLEGREVARVQGGVGGSCLLLAEEALSGAPQAGTLRGRWERDPAVQAGAAGLLGALALGLLVRPRRLRALVRRRGAASRTGD